MICDKPMTFNLYEAEDLAATVEKSGVVFALTHNYTGYPLDAGGAADDSLRRAWGDSGHPLDLLAGMAAVTVGDLRHKQASWRTDPMKSGAAGSFGDLGTHAFNLARYLTGLDSGRSLVHLEGLRPGRQLDDYGHAVIRYENGALGHGHDQSDHARPRERPRASKSTEPREPFPGGRKSPTK